MAHSVHGSRATQSDRVAREPIGRRVRHGPSLRVLTLRRREAVAGVLFVAPQLLGFTVFVLGPLLAVLTFGLFRWNIIFGELEFIGFSNYRQMFEDPEVWDVALTTVLFGFGFVPLTVLGGLGLAVALNRKTNVSIALRTAYFMPVVISLAAWTIVWRLLLQPNGPVNALLEMAGASPIAWLRSPAFALISVIGVQVLKTLGYAMVLFLAALQTVPSELIEAARVDGASQTRTFRHVTVPLIAPFTFMVTVLLTIASVQDLCPDPPPHRRRARDRDDSDVLLHLRAGPATVRYGVCQRSRHNTLLGGTRSHRGAIRLTPPMGLRRQLTMRSPSMIRRFGPGRIALTVVLSVGAIILILPLIWMVSSSLKPEFDIFVFPPEIIPDPIYWENYRAIFEEAPLGRQYFNSIYIGLLNVVGTVVVSALAGYSLAKLRFPGRFLVLPLLLCALLLPTEVIIVPLYALMTRFGWIGTHLPLIVEPVFGAPAVVGTFLMRQFFLSIPDEIEDAGRVDGLGTFGVFLHVALPLARPRPGYPGAAHLSGQLERLP